MAQASQAVGDLQRAVDVAATNVLACVGEDMALEHARKLAEAGAIAQALMGLDRICTVSQVPMGPRTYQAARTVAGNYRPPDLQPWTSALAVLKENPMAEVVIARPEAMVPALPSPIIPTWPPKMAVPIAPKPLSPEEADVNGDGTEDRADDSTGDSDGREHAT
jgi:hypothetical protein